MKKINFLQFVTKRELKNFFEQNGYYEMTEKEKPFLKTKDKDNGKMQYYYFCKKEEIEKGNSLNHYISPNVKKALINFTISSLSLLSFGGDYCDDSKKMLIIDDFYVYDMFTNDGQDIDRNLLKNYQEFMTKKFGDYYKKSLNKFYKDLKKESKQAENKNQIENDEQEELEK